MSSERPNVWTRLQRFFAGQTISDSLRFAISIPLLGITVSSLAVAFGASRSGEKPETALILSFAGILAGLAGLLFALIVFAVEFEAGRSGSLAPLTRFIHRQRGVIGHAAFITGVIAAAAVLAAFTHLGVPLSPTATTLFALTGFLLAIWLVMLNLHAVVFPSPSTVLARIQLHLLFELEGYIDEELAARELVERYSTACKELRLRVEPWGLLGDRIESIWLTKKGIVSDVSVEGLRALADEVSVMAHSWEPVLCLRPGMSSSEFPALMLKRKPESDRSFHAGTEESDVPPEQDEVPVQEGLGDDLPRLRRRVDETFLVEPPSLEAREFGVGLQLLVTSIEEDASSGHDLNCEKKLEALTRVVEAWLHRAGSISGLLTIGDHTPSFFPKTLEGTLWRLVQKADESRSPDVIGAVEHFLLSGIKLGSDAHSDELIQAYVRLLNGHYRHYADNHHEEHSSRRFDRLVSLLLHTAPIKEDRRDDDHPWRPFVLGGLLRILRDSFERKRLDDFDRVFTQLLDGTSFRIVTDEDDGVWVDGESEEDVLRQTVVVIMAAWASRRASEDREQYREAAMHVAERCADRTQSSRRLAIAWEHASVEKLAARLGVENWESELLDIRPGFSASGTGDTDWLRGGLALLAVRSTSAFTQLGSLPLLAETSDNAWDPARIRSRLESMPDFILDLPDEELSDRKRQLVEFLEEVQIKRLRSSLDAIIEASVSQDRVSRLDAELKDVRPSEPGMLPVLKRMGLSEPARSTPFRASARWHLPRQGFVSGHPEDYGIAATIANRMQVLRDVQSFGCAEHFASKSPHTVSRETVNRIVQAEVIRQRKQGLRPNLILIPRWHSWRRALFGNEYSLDRRTDDWGPQHVGILFDCHVLRWPHENASSVLVANCASVFGTALASETLIEISISEMPAAEREAVEKRAAVATRSDEMPRTEEIFVQCDAVSTPTIGLVRPESATRIDVQAEDD